MPRPLKIEHTPTFVDFVVVLTSDCTFDKSERNPLTGIDFYVDSGVPLDLSRALAKSGHTRPGRTRPPKRRRFLPICSVWRNFSPLNPRNAFIQVVLDTTTQKP